jgi:hypothetical protein
MYSKREYSDIVGIGIYRPTFNQPVTGTAMEVNVAQPIALYGQSQLKAYIKQAKRTGTVCIMSVQVRHAMIKWHNE